MHGQIAILGSTGSIGRAALEVISKLGAPYRAVGLTANSQYERLLAQTKMHKPSAVVLSNGIADKGSEFEKLGAEVYSGPTGLCQLVTRSDIDTVIAAIVGVAGLPAVFAAVEAGKRVALANKESLVVAGALLMPLAKEKGAEILPVDSEHSAIFQACRAGNGKEISRVILTASGGPFLKTPINQMESATKEQALAHPTWKMGAKVTVDSATMFNKALEIIEAHWLFGLPPEKISVVIHPQSVVHSMVEFVDGSVIAQLSPTDMKIPIQYALTYPDRVEGVAGRLDWEKAMNLNFEPPDPSRFIAIRLAYEAIRKGGTACAALNGANEAAVEAFMSDKIRFMDISRLVEAVLERHQVQKQPTIVDLLDTDCWARELVRSMIKNGKRAL